MNHCDQCRAGTPCQRIQTADQHLLLRISIKPRPLRRIPRPAGHPTIDDWKGAA